MGLKIKFKAAVIVLVVAFLLLPTVSRAAENLKQKALRGLKGVEVIVEDMKPEAERLGLTLEQIRTDVELRLRKAGVRVLTEGEQLEMPGNPYLSVNVNTVFSSGTCAYASEVKLKEWVTLARGFKVGGSIWDTGSVGLVGIQNVRQKIRGSVADLVDKFINDYLAANPK